jgi:hypothetical protein
MGRAASHDEDDPAWDLVALARAADILARIDKPGLAADLIATLYELIDENPHLVPAPIERKLSIG